MTNPACTTCEGWGFKNKVVGSKEARGFSRYGTTPIFDNPVMELCDDVYPSDDRIPPHLRGQPCTPRTAFVRHAAPSSHGHVHDDGRMRGGMRLASEKRLETRQRNAAARAANSTKQHKPSRSNRGR